MRHYSSIAQAAELTGAISSAAESINVSTTSGWPLTCPFTIVLDVGTPAEEILTVTAVSGSILTVTRGQDGSASVAHAAGASVRHMMSARDMREPQEHMAATTGVHGLEAGSAVVGTTDNQTLTGKSMSGTDNQFANIPESAVTGLTLALDGLDAAVLTVDGRVDGEITLRVAHEADTSTHGVTGQIVGTENAQTLTNKTLVSPVVTNPPANIGLPAGVEMLWAGGEIPPTGWLLEDGAAVSRTTYAALFAAIGITYGPGDGTTTFNLPNWKGRFPVGLDATDADFETAGKTGGAKAVALVNANMPQHNHPITHGANGPTMAITQSSAADGVSPEGNRWHLADGTAALLTGMSGAASPTPHQNLPPYSARRFIIKT